VAAGGVGVGVGVGAGVGVSGRRGWGVRPAGCGCSCLNGVCVCVVQEDARRSRVRTSGTAKTSRTIQQSDMRPEGKYLWRKFGGSMKMLNSDL